MDKNKRMEIHFLSYCICKNQNKNNLIYYIIDYRNTKQNINSRINDSIKTSWKIIISMNY